MDPKEKTLRISKQSDLTPIVTLCPKCGNKYVYGTKYVKVPCDCGLTYNTDFHQTLYMKTAHRIFKEFSRYNKLTLIFNENYDTDLYVYEKIFKEYKCFDILPIESEDEEHRFCNQCGTCKSCVTCKNCGMAWKKDSRDKKQRCPQCKSNKYVKSKFKEVFVSEENKNIKLCPHCKSDDIRFTYTTQKTKCHECGSKNLSQPIKKTYFKLIIERKKMFYC